MALVLKFQIKEVTNEDKIEAFDATEDGEDGWGVGGNPNRSERALLFYCKYVDEDGAESYLEQEDHLVGSNLLFAVEDGPGLANTTRSKFTVESASDGQHNYYLLPLERDSTKVGGNDGDLYFNTDDGLPYYYNGSVWIEITDDTLSLIEDSGAIQSTNQLMRKRARKKLAEVTRDIYSVEDGYDKQLREQRDEYSSRLFLAGETFVSGNESSGRVLLDNLKSFRF